MTLSTGEFIRRFLIHVLPQGFHRIRHYGLLASGTRADNIARARRLLDVTVAQPEAVDTNGADAKADRAPVSVLRRPHRHHREVPARLRATYPAGDSNRDQDRHVMISLGSPQHSSAAILLRRLSTGDDHARPRAAQDSHLVVQSSSLGAGSAYRCRPTRPSTSPTASQSDDQRTSATDRCCRNPHGA
jgi:hypothetical protein